MNLLGIIFLIISVTKCSVLFTAAHLVITNPDAPEGRIIGGQATSPHEYPYMVSLQIRLLWVRAHFCGGSLLSKNWVLTAGHCITESWLIRWLNIDAVAGAHNVNSFTKDVQIQKIVERIEHHNYRGGIGPNDIAVLKTEYPFVFTKEVQPIRLPPANVDLRGGSLTLTGWGAQNSDILMPQLPSLLQELSVNFVAYNSCYDQVGMFLEKSDESNPLDKESNICSGPLDGGKAACVGDSGGPLILSHNKKRFHTEFEDDDYEDWLKNEINTKAEIYSKKSKEGSEEYVVGVVSWGVSPCGETGAPTVYTDVSKYLDFIHSYVRDI